MASTDDTPAGRVRVRMQRWLETTGMGQREFAADLKKTQVWLQKILSGENHVRLKDLDDVAQAMRTTAAELVRGPEERYRLELTPTEVRILERLRHRPEAYDAIAYLLRIPPAPSTQSLPAKFNEDTQQKNG